MSRDVATRQENYAPGRFMPLQHTPQPHHCDVTNRRNSHPGKKGSYSFNGNTSHDMRAGRVIADSDDSDEFSPVPSPLRTLPSSSARSAEGAGASSADPGFFQSAYLARQDAVARDAGSNGDGELAAPGAEGTDAYDPWALMSSPDELRNTPRAKKTTRPRGSKTFSKKGGLVSSDTSPKNGPGLVTSANNDTPSKALRTYSKKKETGVTSNDTSHGDALGIGTPETKNGTPTKATRTYSRKDPGVGSSAASAYEVVDLVSPDQRGTARQTSQAAKRNVDEANGDYGDISTRPSKKKRISDLRIGGAGGLEDGSVDVPASFGASPGAGSMAPPTKQNAQDSSKGDSGYLYVETSRMTASQKQQYEEVSFPSLSSIDEPNLRQYTHLARSSGSATIAYPTPTQYRRPDPSMPPLQESPSPVGSKRGSGRGRLSSLPPTADNPGSSPDVISGPQEGDGVDPAAQAEPRIVEQDNDCDEDWNEEDFGFPRQQEPRPCRTKKRSRPPEQDTEPPLMQDGMATTAQYTENAEVQVTSAAQQSVEQPPILKKRGRKKKEKAPEPEPEPESDPAVSAAEDQSEDVPPQKRKRGRPRKSHKAGGTDNVPVQDAKVPDPDPRSETSHNVGDGSERAGSCITGTKEDDEQDSKEDGGTSAKTDGEGDAEDVSPGRRVLAGTGQEPAGTSAAEGGNVSAGRDSAADGKGEVAEKGQAAPGKAAASQTPGVKPVYRVGLSRRTRIAPLLKSIRKG